MIYHLLENCTRSTNGKKPVMEENFSINCEMFLGWLLEQDWPRGSECEVRDAGEVQKNALLTTSARAYPIKFTCLTVGVIFPRSSQGDSFLVFTTFYTARSFHSFRVYSSDHGARYVLRLCFRSPRLFSHVFAVKRNIERDDLWCFWLDGLRIFPLLSSTFFNFVSY